MANHDGKRICTWKSWDCPYETTILARGEVYLGLGTYDLQRSCLLLTVHRAENCVSGEWETA